MSPWFVMDASFAVLVPFNSELMKGVETVNLCIDVRDEEFKDGVN